MNYLLRFMAAAACVCILLSHSTPAQAYLTPPEVSGIEQDTTYKYSQSGSGDVDAPAYTWIDISDTGIAFDPGGSTNLATLGLTVPTFNFFGEEFNSIRQDGDGSLYISNDSSTAYIDAIWTSAYFLPDTSKPAYAEVRDGKIIIQFNKVYNEADLDKSDPGSFEYIIDTTTGTVLVSYKSIPGPDITQGENSSQYVVGLEYYGALTKKLFVYYSDKSSATGSTPASTAPKSYAGTTIAFYPDTDNDGIYYNQDCDDTDSATGIASIAWYADTDNDGLGNSTATTMACAGVTPAGYVSNNSDTNDADSDNDGASTAADCNDNDATVVADRVYYLDADQDGYGSTTITATICQSTPPTNYVTNNTDTDDNDPTSNGCVTATAGDRQAQSCVSPTDVTIASSITSTTAGGITVTYGNNDTATYQIFKPSSGKPDAVKQLTSTEDEQWILVLSGNGKRLALVDAATGTVLDRLKLSKKAFSNNRLQLIDDDFIDGNNQTIIISSSSKKRSAGKVSVIKLKLATGSFGQKVSKQYTAPLKLKKTTYSKKIGVLAVRTTTGVKRKYAYMIINWKLSKLETHN